MGVVAGSTPLPASSFSYGSASDAQHARAQDSIISARPRVTGHPVPGEHDKPRSSAAARARHIGCSGAAPCAMHLWELTPTAQCSASRASYASRDGSAPHASTDMHAPQRRKTCRGVCVRGRRAARDAREHRSRTHATQQSWTRTARCIPRTFLASGGCSHARTAVSPPQAYDTAARESDRTLCAMGEGSRAEAVPTCH